MKLLTLIFSILILPQFAYLQTKSNVRCEFKKPPVLRGFYMGQTVEEINNVIPNFQTVFNEQRELESRPKLLSTRTEAGFTLVTDTDVFYPVPGKRIIPNQEFEDAEFYWHFLDNKLFFISVRYTEFKPTNLKNFVQQVAEKTNLPTNGWLFKDKNHAILKCIGFDIEVWTGKVAGRPDYADYPSVMVTDTNAEAELERREKAIETRKKKVELERLRREKEKKTVFKP